MYRPRSAYCQRGRSMVRNWTYSRNCFSPTQSHSKNTGSCLPRSQINGISRPICHPRPYRPSLILRLDRIHIGICPYMRGSQRRLLFGQSPCRNSCAALLQLRLRGNISHLGRVLHLGDGLSVKLQSIIPSESDTLQAREHGGREKYI